MTNYREYLSSMRGLGGGLLSPSELHVLDEIEYTTPDRQAILEIAQSDRELTQNDINAEIFKSLFFNALTKDFEASGLLKQPEESKPIEAKPKEEGRNKPVKIENLRGAKPGWKMAEGSNFWTINEKDLYWKTKAGFKEAMDLYGVKPNWVKEPSLEYNPTTGEYEPIVKEEFAEIKQVKRISL
jgi:hypothetical protein